MKKWILAVLFSLGALASQAQRFQVEYPYVESSYQSRYGTTRIERVMIEDRETRVYISYTSVTSEEISIALNANTTLSSSDGKRVTVTKWGWYNGGSFVDLDFGRSYAVRSGSVFRFYLVFPRILATSESISIQENVEGGFYWRGIRLSQGQEGADAENQPDSRRPGTHRHDGAGQSGQSGDSDSDREDHSARQGRPQGGYGGGDDNGDSRQGRGYETPGTRFPERFNLTASGTCFALNGEGYLVTCHHVIEGARKFRIRGINGDFENPLRASIVAIDEENDLAILKIDDDNFSGLGDVPYRIESTPSEVGEEVFTLGYPLRALMGDEIKLTNGVISACSGYQGDVTTYQLSAVVQSGNSGCPAFNADGNVIGVISSRLENIEGASYAVKERYLIDLIRAHGISMPSGALSMSNEPMTARVRTVKPFVYIVEVGD